MDLSDAVEAGNTKAVKAALSHGAKPSVTDLEQAITKPFDLLRLLLEKTPRSELAKKAPSREESLLLSVGMEIRSAYPQAARMKRLKDPGAAEPSVIVDLRKKAALLRAAGAPLDFGAAAMLGYAEDVRSMLARDPKHATRKVYDQNIAELAAWSGAWETSRLIKEARTNTGQKPFHWKKVARAMYEWAKKSLAKFAKQHAKDVFGRVAFDVDGADILLVADREGRASKRPGAYSHGEIANFGDHSLSQSVAAQLDAKTEQAYEAARQAILGAAAEAAHMLERDRTIAIERSVDFMVLVFEHDEEEVAALARRGGGKAAKPARGASAKKAPAPKKATKRR